MPFEASVIFFLLTAKKQKRMLQSDQLRYRDLTTVTHHLTPQCAPGDRVGEGRYTAKFIRDVSAPRFKALPFYIPWEAWWPNG